MAFLWLWEQNKKKTIFVLQFFLNHYKKEKENAGTVCTVSFTNFTHLQILAKV